MQIKETTVQKSNVIAEKGERVLFPSGILAHIGGKAHKDGGTPINVEEGSMIFSDAIKLPSKVVSTLMGKNMPKMSPAELAGKFDTSSHIEILNNPDVNQYKKNTHEVYAAKKLESLKNIFLAQEEFKKSKGIESGKMMTADQQKEVAQVGTQVGGNPLSLSSIFNRNRTPSYKDEFVTDFASGNIEAEKKRQFEEFDLKNIKPGEVQYSPWGMYTKDENGTIINLGMQNEKSLAGNINSVTFDPKTPGNLTANYNTWKQNVLFEPTVPRETRGEAANQVDYLPMTNYDINAKSYKHDDAKGVKLAKMNAANSFERQQSYNTHYNMVWIDKRTGKAVAKLGDGQFHPDQAKRFDGSIPTVTREQAQQFVNDPNIVVEWPGTNAKNTKSFISNNGMATGYNAMYNKDDNQFVAVENILGSDTKTMQYTPKPKPVMLPDPASPPIVDNTKPADSNPPNTNMRWREMEEMEKEKYRDFGALINNQMGIPYYNNPSKMPAYNRFVPLNTLQQQQQQMLANRSMRASGIPEQLTQSITANTAASAQNAIGQVQLQNARGAVENSNQNNQIFANTYNQNEEIEAQNLRRYAMENQDAFAKFKKNQETIYDKMESDSMAKAKVYDNYYAQKNLGIQQGDPYLLTDPKKSGLFNRRINVGYEFNPNNRYTKDNNNKGILAAGNEDVAILDGIINSPESSPKEKLEALQLKHGIKKQ